MEEDKNRGKISTTSIAAKLNQVKDTLKQNSVSIEPVFIPKKEEQQPLLFVHGKLNRKKYQYTAKNFALLTSIENEIKACCKGIDLTVLNYLIYLGLESIKSKKDFTSIDWSELETKLK